MLAIIMTIEDVEDSRFVADVYTRCSERMFSIAMNVLHNRYDAEDCVHDTMVKIIDKLGEFREADKREYLIKLVSVTCRNTAINKYNKNLQRAGTTFSTTMYDDDGEASLMDIPDDSADVEKIVINEFTCRYVAELIDKLELKYRDVIILKSMGYDYDSIAYFMSITPVLARKRYSRARAMILEMGGETLHEYMDRR